MGGKVNSARELPTVAQNQERSIPSFPVMEQVFTKPGTLHSTLHSRTGVPGSRVRTMETSYFHLAEHMWGRGKEFQRQADPIWVLWPYLIAVVCE